MKVSAILAAAGAGSRLRKSVPSPFRLPKALWPLADQPIFLHSLETLLTSPAISEIILVLPPAELRKIKSQMESLSSGRKRIHFVSGGSSRADSVYRGLKRVSRASSWVLVHDAARPFLTVDGIRSVLNAARHSGAAIAAKPIRSTVKQSQGGKVLRTVSRDHLWEAQTPQVSRKEWLEKAYRNYLKHPFPATDESSLLEAIGKSVELVPLHQNNLKITTGEDLELAEKWLRGPVSSRVGHGTDLHRLIKGRPFLLGGERLKWHSGPLGHSDGDVLLHALSDAILGAVGMGDIGEYFSDRDRRFKNISSQKILAHGLKLAGEKGWHIENADCIIHLEKPRLGSYKTKIRRRVAALLGLSVDAVNIKAKTAEGLGSVGRGEAVACDVTVLMRQKKGSL